MSFSQRDLSRLVGVHPELQRLLGIVFDEMLQEGYRMFVIEGVRSDERQAQLYLIGRGRPGRIVTYKDGVHFRSLHQPRMDGYGYAVDSAFSATQTVSDPFSHLWPWEKYGEQLEANGLIWGGRWKMSDLPHAELPVSLASPSLLAP